MTKPVAYLYYDGIHCPACARRAFGWQKERPTDANGVPINPSTADWCGVTPQHADTDAYVLDEHCHTCEEPIQQEELTS